MVTQAKFGERYFAYKAAMGKLLGDIKELGLEIDPGHPFVESNKGERLSGDHFQFFVVGDLKVGKSAFINALSGYELSKSNEESNPLRHVHYQYGTRYNDVKNLAYVEQRYRPIELLRNYHFVEAPSLREMKKGQAEITQSYLGSSDLLFFIFSIHDPWGSSSWNFLSSLSKEQISRTVLLIQKADLLDEEEHAGIKKQVSALSIRALGDELPVFVISATLAVESKKQGFIFAKSGFLELEAFLSKQLFLAPEKLARSKSQCLTAYRALRAQEEFLEKRNRGFLEQSYFVQSLDNKIEELCDRLLGKIPHHMQNITEVFQKESLRYVELFERKLNFIKSVCDLLTGRSSADQVESDWLKQLRCSMDELLESDSKDILDLCLEHWSDMNEKFQNRRLPALEEVEVLSEKLEPARREFIRHLAQAADRKMKHFPLHKTLQVALRMRNLSLKSFLVASLLCLSTGALTGILSLPWLPVIFCLSGGVLLSGAILSSVVSRKKVTQIFKETTWEASAIFSQDLSIDYEKGLRRFFHDYHSCLNELRECIEKRRDEVDAIQKRWHHLFLKQKSLEQELRVE